GGWSTTLPAAGRRRTSTRSTRLRGSGTSTPTTGGDVADGHDGGVAGGVVAAVAQAAARARVDPGDGGGAGRNPGDGSAGRERAGPGVAVHARSTRHLPPNVPRVSVRAHHRAAVCSTAGLGATHVGRGQPRYAVCSPEPRRQPDRW